MEKERNIECLCSEENKAKLREAILFEYKEHYLHEHDCEASKAIVNKVKKSLVDIGFITLVRVEPQDLDESVKDYFREECLADFVEKNSSKYSYEEMAQFVEDLDLPTLAEMEENGELINSFRFAMGEDLENDDEFEIEQKDDESEDIKQKYFVELEIKHHHGYSPRRLRNRIEKRLGYKWETFMGSHIITFENGTWRVLFIFDADFQPIETIEKRIKFRFGSTSGRPWNGCKVVRVEENNVAEDFED